MRLHSCWGCVFICHSISATRLSRPIREVVSLPSTARHGRAGSRLRQPSQQSRRRIGETSARRRVVVKTRQIVRRLPATDRQRDWLPTNDRRLPIYLAPAYRRDRSAALFTDVKRSWSQKANPLRRSLLMEIRTNWCWPAAVRDRPMSYMQLAYSYSNTSTNCSLSSPKVCMLLFSALEYVSK